MKHFTLEGTGTVAIAAVIAASTYMATAHADTPFSKSAPYVQAGVYYHDGEFDEMKAHGNLDFPIVLNLSVGYQWKNGWFVEGVHYSNPEAADTGLNLIGGGFRYAW